jgi:hypothetical protein
LSDSAITEWYPNVALTFKDETLLLKK